MKVVIELTKTVC